MPQSSRQPTPIRDAHFLTAERWRSLLFNRFPILGSVLRNLAIHQLIQLCKKGDPSAGRVLAEGLSLAFDPAAVHKIGNFLSTLSNPVVITALWEQWNKSRQDQLKLTLARLGQPATPGSPVYVLSCICLHYDLPIRNFGANIVDQLVDLLRDRDEDISASALSLVSSLKSPAAIERLGSIWAQSRDSLLEKVITNAGYQARKPPQVKILMALKWNHPELVVHTGPEGVIPLENACRDQDKTISDLALSCILNLQEPAAVDELCRLWIANRSPIIEKAIIQANYTAEKPLSVQLLIQLKTGRLEQVSRIPPQGLETLLDACRDSDPTISANARTCLGKLINPATIDAFCQCIIDSPEPVYIQTALQANYTPLTPQNCALFFFLTNQVERFESLDFDRRMMRAVYEVAALPLKARITHQVQISGKTDDLAILGGLNISHQSGPITTQEIDLMVRLLNQNQEWNRLWKLVFELPISWSISVLRLLAQTSWLPSDTSDKEVYARLTAFVQQELYTNPMEFERALPLALKRATLRVPGRINSLAFDSHRSILAIGTGQRKLALWDFQTETMQRVLSGFNHSIGQIAFCGQHLVCGQRSNQNALCSIYAWENDQSYLLGSHIGMVSSLIPVDESQVFSTGHDGKAVLWDLTGRRALSTIDLPFWARSSAVSPDRRMVALAYESLAIASLPDITLLPHSMANSQNSGVRAGPARKITFTPGGDGILVGQFNGQIVYYEVKEDHRLLRKKLVMDHHQPVVGLQFIPNHAILVSSSPAGHVCLTAWPSQEKIGEVITGLAITSQQISADGSFMALGTRDSKIILWDLRVHDLPSLYATPLAHITPGQSAAISSLLEERDLAPALQNTLSLFMALIQQRFQFNIEIEEAPVIRKGEFDIIID